MTGLSMSKVVHVRRGFSACDSYVNVRIHKQWINVSRVLYGSAGFELYY